MNGLISDVMDLVKEFSAHLLEEHLSEHEPFFTLNGISMEFLRDKTSLHMDSMKHSHIYTFYIQTDFDGSENSIMNIAVFCIIYLMHFLPIWFLSCLTLWDCYTFPTVTFFSNKNTIRIDMFDSFESVVYQKSNNFIFQRIFVIYKLEYENDVNFCSF